MKTQRTIPAAAALIGLVLLLGGAALAQRSIPEPFPDRPHFPRPLHDDGVANRTDVDARLDGSILQVLCEQTFHNHGHRAAEVEILLPVPADAVVTDGLLLADGHEYRAEVLAADEARRIYEEIVRSRRDPALLELVGHGLVRLSAFPIPPGGSRTVSFRYHQSLPDFEGRTRLLLPVAALCGIDRVGPLDFHLAVRGSDPLTQIYSPSHDLLIEREGSTEAEISYTADPPNLRETLELIVVRDHRSIGIDLRTARGHGEDDYFLLAVSPGWELLQRRRDEPETQIFVLDTSGSMEGEKFTQARLALQRFLEEISPDDRFNLIAFSNEVSSLFETGPRRATAEARREARVWLDRLEAGGGTAIADAIEEACRPRWEADLVLFLTDGLPTVGETRADAILRRLCEGDPELRFFAFGVGYDVDARLLDDLARRGSGSVSYVKPGEDVAEAVTVLRRRVEHPCARDVRIEVRGARVRELFPQGARDLFAGEPLLFAGRVDENAGRATVELSAEGPDGRRLSESWQVDFDDSGSRSSAVPVLWASRKCAALIDQIRREGSDRRALDELCELSKRYGILNEEVALLAREPEAGPVFADRDRLAHTPAVQLGGGSLRAQSASKEEVQIAAEAWRLSGATTTAKLKPAEEKTDGEVTIEGITFRLQGDVWTDTRLDQPVPRGTETLRIRAYGAAYFKLAGGGGPLAAWMSFGERLRVLLPGIILEFGPEGDDQLPNETIDRIRQAADRA